MNFVFCDAVLFFGGVYDWLNNHVAISCVFWWGKNLLRLYHAKYHLAKDLPTSLKQLQKLGICMILSAVGAVVLTCPIPHLNVSLLEITANRGTL